MLVEFDRQILTFYTEMDAISATNALANLAARAEVTSLSQKARLASS
jgi:hypothetical protein